MSYRRPAWVEDHEVFFYEIALGYSTLSAADQKALCGEVDSGINITSGGFSGSPPTHYAGVVFNQLMDIDRYYVGGRVRFGLVGAHYGGWRNVEYSTDTTDGEDGTWNIAEAMVDDDAEHTVDGWRTPVTLTSALTGIKGIRFGIRGALDGGDLYMVHVYGAQTTGDRVEFWHPTLDQALTLGDMYFDKIVWGESGSLDFRIKNSSGSTLADNVVLSSDIVTDGSPSVLPNIEFSDGGAYATTLDIGDVTAGTISSTITMRISPDTDDTPIVELLYPAIVATPTSGPPKSSIYTSFRIMDHYPYTAYDASQLVPRNGPWAVFYDAKQVVPRNGGLSFYDAEQMVEVKPDIGIYNGAWHLPQTVYNNELSLGGMLAQTTLARLLNESWGSSTVPAVVDPISQSTPALWLAADSLGLSDTDPVSTWTDLSSNGRDATMSGATYDADGGPGGNPGVITPSQGTVPAFMSGDGEMVLVYTTAPSGTGSGFDEWGTHGFNSHYPYSNNDVYTDWGNNSRRDQIDTISYSAGYLIGTHSATSDWAYYRDDLNPKYSTTSLNPVWSTNPHNIGVVGATISEFVVWDRKLSFNERAEIYKHLGTKYGLTIANLPNTTPAPSFPSVATPSARWDATAITGLSHGDTVSTWADLSGNGYDLDTVTNQTYVENGINGRPAVDFAGDDYMYLSGLNDLDLTGDFYVIAAVEFDVTGSGQRTIVGKSYQRWELAETSATMVGYVGGASNPVYGGTLSANTPYVLAIRRTGGSTFSSRLDGTEMQSTSNSASATGGTSLHVGVRPGGSYWMNGTIGEIIIYNSDISDTDRDLLETYMTTKWT